MKIITPRYSMTGSYEMITAIKTYRNIHTNAVIETIKKSKDTDTAKINLMERFKLSEIQAKAILEMRLQRLTGLEREKIENEYKEILQLIEKHSTNDSFNISIHY